MAIFYRTLRVSSSLLEAPTAALRERTQNVAVVCATQRFCNKIAAELVVGRGGIWCLGFAVQLTQGNFQHYQIAINSRTVDRFGLFLQVFDRSEAIGRAGDDTGHLQGREGRGRCTLAVARRKSRAAGKRYRTCGPFLMHINGDKRSTRSGCPQREVPRVGTPAPEVQRMGYTPSA
jgi:hypothetical protein